MQYTSLGFKKPELTDLADIRIAVGDNMDLINAEISAKQSIIIKGTGTIPTTGWVANTGDYALKLDYAITGVTATDVVDVVLDKDVHDVAGDAELCPTNESYAGGVTFFCKVTPTATMAFSYKVVK